MLTKEEALQEARRLGIARPEELQWNELTAAIAERQALERAKNQPTSEDYQRLQKELEAERAKTKAFKRKYEGYDEGEEPDKETLKKQPVVLAPEIKAGNRPKYPKYMFEEELNNDVAYTDDDYVKNGRPSDLKRGDYAVGEYGHQAYLDTKVKAQTGGPRSNAAIIWNPDEVFKSIKVGNKQWYQWAHVQAVLKDTEGGIFLAKINEELDGARNRNSVLKCINRQYIIDKKWLNLKLKQITEEYRRDKIRKKREDELLGLA